MAGVGLEFKVVLVGGGGYKFCRTGGGVVAVGVSLLSSFVILLLVGIGWAFDKI